MVVVVVMGHVVNADVSKTDERACEKEGMMMSCGGEEEEKVILFATFVFFYEKKEAIDNISSLRWMRVNYNSTVLSTFQCCNN